MTFMALLGVTVAMAVQAVGTLLLFALVVTPAATAIMLTPRPVRAMAASTAISLSAVWCGLGASAMFNLPPSFPIVTIACAIWAAVWVSDRRRRVAAQAIDESGDGSPNVPSLPRQTSAISNI
jgi:zinc/manganese transport system permease protein